MIERKVSKSGKIILLLRIPPPLGGGEILGDALKEYVQKYNDFKVIVTNSSVRTKADQGRVSYKKIFDFLSLWYQLLCLLVRDKPLLVFSPLAKSFPHFFRDSLLFWSCWVFRVPFAGELAGSGFYFIGKNPVYTWYGRLVLSRMLCVRTLGNQIANELSSYDIRNTIVSDNGVKQVACCLAKKNRDKNGVFKILYVGTLSPGKGFSDFIAACACVIDNSPNILISVIGEWISNEYERLMCEQIQRYGLRDSVYLHGVKHGQDRDFIFANSDLLVLPSYTEGQPLVILEALSCGIPIVATNVGAIPATIESGVNGYLVYPGDQGELCRAILALARNSDLCEEISLRNMKLYSERYTEESFLSTQVSWLRECAEGTLEPRGQYYVCQRAEQ